MLAGAVVYPKLLTQGAVHLIGTTSGCSKSFYFVIQVIVVDWVECLAEVHEADLDKTAPI